MSKRQKKIKGGTLIKQIQWKLDLKRLFSTTDSVLWVLVLIFTNTRQTRLFTSKKTKMEFTKEQIKKELESLNYTPMFEGSNHHMMYGQLINIDNINTLGGLIIEVFNAGQRKKIKDFKDLMNIQ